MVDAMADPRNKANQTSTRRVMNLAFRKDCMEWIMPNLRNFSHLIQMYSFGNTLAKFIAVLRLK
jgi:hypothetical protein